MMMQAHRTRYKREPNTLYIDMIELPKLRKENPSVFTIDHKQVTHYGSLIVKVPVVCEMRVTWERQ